MSPNDTAGLSRRDLVRVGAGAVAGAASASAATARPQSPDRSGDPVQLQGDANQTGGNQTGGNQTGGNQTGGNQTGGNQTGGNQTGGNQTGGNQTGGNQTDGPLTPQDEGAALEQGGSGRTPADGPDTGTLALFGVAGVLAFLSPLALVVLMFRNAGREEERY